MFTMNVCGDGMAGIDFDDVSCWVTNDVCRYPASGVTGDGARQFQVSAETLEELVRIAVEILSDAGCGEDYEVYSADLEEEYGAKWQEVLQQ